MFNDINEVTLMGNVTNDPDLRFTPSGSAVLSFGMATNRSYKQGDEWKEEASFHNIVIWGDRAQRLAERIQKGTRLIAKGRLQTRSWDGNDGKKNYKTEVIADTISLISRYKGEGQAGGGFSKGSKTASAPTDNPTPAPETEDNGGGDIIDPDDLPF
jgi:single-strand DNA-binding protein